MCVAWLRLRCWSRWGAGVGVCTSSELVEEESPSGSTRETQSGLTWSARVHGPALAMLGMAGGSCRAGVQVYERARMGLEEELPRRGRVDNGTPWTVPPYTDTRLTSSTDANPSETSTPQPV